MAQSSRRNTVEHPDPRVLRCVRQAALAGLALVLVWPAMRGSSAWIGWLPLWLLGMPLSAWWALYRFRLPAAWRTRRQGAGNRQRPQARRLRHARRGTAVRAA
ncbi:hypothetical protein CQ393_08350 [Stenotrophomonas sp. MYb238]|uniref:hypothetical protein n=1 Tax=Stenotrophomonas sp. MYb238 TaxID=2040281 RepID=UPI001290F5D0|nr:hypothetical protein [Stenotrophomonas sp. MYb238]MQP75900.1 hypothetical protein [Stenotrophomonas sp. MYb238]